MILFKGFVAFSAVLFASVAQAGMNFKIETFTTANVATSSFALGDTVQVRLTGTDTAGAPTLGVDPLFNFSAKLTASTSDVNDANSFVNPFTNAQNGGQNFDSSNGRDVGGSMNSGSTLASTNPFTFLTFRYTASVLGDTVLGFNNSPVGSNQVGFVAGGNLVDINTGNGLTLSGTTVTITAVPEPTSMALLGMALACGGATAIRRRFTKKTALKA